MVIFNSYVKLPEGSRGYVAISLPILDTLQNMTNSLLVNVDNSIDTKKKLNDKSNHLRLTRLT